MSNYRRRPLNRNAVPGTAIWHLAVPGTAIWRFSIRASHGDLGLYLLRHRLYDIVILGLTCVFNRFFTARDR